MSFSAHWLYENDAPKLCGKSSDTGCVCFMKDKFQVVAYLVGLKKATTAQNLFVASEKQLLVLQAMQR